MNADDYLADDEEPMIAKEGEQDPTSKYYVEKRKFCFYFSWNCAFISIGVLMLIDFLIELIAKLFLIS